MLERITPNFRASEYDTCEQKKGPEESKPYLPESASDAFAFLTESLLSLLIPLIDISTHFNYHLLVEFQVSQPLYFMSLHLAMMKRVISRSQCPSSSVPVPVRDFDRLCSICSYMKKTNPHV
jgi:hypothetical protein